MVAPLSIDQRMRTGYKPYNPMQGAGFGGGTGIMDMLVQMMGQSFIGGKGMLPLGVTHQNLYDRFQSLKLQQLHDEVMKESAKQDAQSLTDTWLGLMALQGRAVGKQQLRDIQSLSQQGAAAIPTLMQFPGMASAIDTALGFRGSASVMSEHMFRGGRFRMDPLTGEMGLGAEAMKGLNKDVFKGMFSGDAALGQQLSAGRMGMMFEELQQLGLMPGGRVTPQDLLQRGTTRDRTALAGAMRRVTGRNVAPENLRRELEQLNPQDLQRLSQDQGVQGIVKAFDHRRVQQTLKDYAGAVNAMQEIFGDAGRPNAPMPQLMNALNQLAGGSLTQMTPGNAEKMVREINNLAQNSGVGLEMMMVVSQLAAQQVQAFGGDPTATPGVVRSMFETRQALQQVGGRPGGFGHSGINQLMAKQGELAAAASESRTANQLATLMRLEHRFGGEGAFAGAAGRLADAVRAGQHRFIGADGKPRSVAMDTQEFIGTLTGGRPGMSRAAVIQALQARHANREFQQMFDTGRIAEAAQPEEFWNRIAAEDRARVGSRVITQLRDMGIGRDAAARLSQRVVSVGIEAIQKMRPEDTDPELRRKIIGDALRSEFRGAAAAGDRDAIDLMRRGDLGQLEDPLWAGLDVVSMQKGTGFGSMSIQDRLRLTNRAMIAARQQARAKSSIEAIQQRALAPLGRAGVWRNLVQAIQTAKAGVDLGDVASKALGGVSDKALIDALTQGPQGGALGELQREGAEFAKVGKQFEQATPQQQLNMHKQLGQARDEYLEAIKEILKIADKRKKLPGQIDAATKKALTGLGERKKQLPAAFGGAMSLRLGGAVTAKRKTVTDQDDGKPEQKGIHTINIAKLIISKDGSAKITALPAGRQ